MTYIGLYGSNHKLLALAGVRMIWKAMTHYGLMVEGYEHNYVSILM